MNIIFYCPSFPVRFFKDEKLKTQILYIFNFCEDFILA